MEKNRIELEGEINGKNWMRRKAIVALREVKRRVLCGEPHCGFEMKTGDGPIIISDECILVTIGKDSRSYPGLNDKEAEIYWYAWNDGNFTASLELEEDLDSIDACVANGANPIPIIENAITRCWEDIDGLEITKGMLEELQEMGAGL